MEQECKGNASETDETSSPLSGIFLIGCAKNVLSEDDRVAGSPAQQDTVRCVCTGG